MKKFILEINYKYKLENAQIVCRKNTANNISKIAKGNDTLEEEKGIVDKGLSIV